MSRAVRRLFALVAAAVAMLALAPAALAACPQTSLADLEEEVMCPVCGTPLELATEAPQAERERAFIVERVEQCQSKDEIKAALVAEFGPAVLAAPDDEGFNLAAYLVPVLALLAAGGAVALATRRWRREALPATTGPAAEPLARADADRLDADLQRFGG